MHMMHLLLPFLATTAVADCLGCRLLPGDRLWPSLDEWDRLNETLHGRLIRGIPLAAPCHDPTYQASECEQLRQVWQVPQTYFPHPVQIMAPVFQNLSCAPYTGEGLPCLQGSLAVYTINVTEAQDVVTGLQFAREKNIRLSIKNTGHDYLGKSAGLGSLGLWTHNLKSISFTNHSSPRYSGPAIRMGAGVQAFEAYQAASRIGLHVVGGDCPTVGLAGGYSQGGGHGPLSTTYGLGADQVLEWEVVTPEGEHLVVTPDHPQHADLYWALTGGGGGTYGVVLSMTAKAFVDGPVGGAGLSFLAADFPNNDTYWNFIQQFYALVPSLVDAGTSIASLFTTEKFTLQVMTKPGASAQDMSDLLDPLTSKLDTHNLTYSHTVTLFSTFLDHVEAYLGPLPYGLYDSSQMIGSRLIPRDNVEGNLTALMKAFRDIAELGYEVDVLAQNVSVAHLDHQADNAVNPVWRDSLLHVVVASYWDYAESKTHNFAIMDGITTSALPLLSRVAPNSGAYLNEADYQDDNWQLNFFGSNYERLVGIKEKYDPAGVLYANKAVGSEAWDVENDGRLCRVN